MKTKHTPRAGFTRPIALLTTSAILVPTLLAGCGGGGNNAQQSSQSAPPPPAETTAAPPPAIGAPNAPKQGMSTKQKVVLLAGAAALYYVYRKYEKNKAPSGVQYYKSEANGRIYYRDPKTHQAIYVTPPSQPISVPAEEAQQYSGYAGYNNQATGQQFGGYGYNPQGQYQGPAGSQPAPTM